MIALTPHNYISIHAPTRGATLIAYAKKLMDLQFQSTLLQEERLYFSFFLLCGLYFNPRSYKRSDDLVSPDNALISISIHAPTRGATAKMHNNPYTYL